jgi:glycogen synthase
MSSTISKTSKKANKVAPLSEIAQEVYETLKRDGFAKCHYSYAKALESRGLAVVTMKDGYTWRLTLPTAHADNGVAYATNGKVITVKFGK